MQDLSKAYKFFSMAADQGWVDGQLQLGIMYYSMLMALVVIVSVIVIINVLLLVLPLWLS